MSSRPQHLVIASNLHVGGGVQVAASFVDEVARLVLAGECTDVANLVRFEVSSEVARNLQPGTSEPLIIDLVNRRPRTVGRALRDRRTAYRSVLTVFGPLYSFPRTERYILGYADVTSLYPSPVPDPRCPIARARKTVRSTLSRFEVSKAQTVVVETTAMRDRVAEVLGARAPRIEVVPNAVNGKVLEQTPDDVIAGTFRAQREPGELLLAYPTRAYPHKNLEFLPAVSRALFRRGVKARFVVTLKPAEWTFLSSDFQSACINLGEVDVGQVATVLLNSDGLFFPSLLEAYSATPIEALALGVGVCASDRDFVKASCGAVPHYFDPTDADSAARAIIASCSEAAPARVARRRAGRELVETLPSAADRARSYLGLLGLYTQDGRS